MGQGPFGEAQVPSVLCSGPVPMNVCDYSCCGDKGCVCVAHHHSSRVRVTASGCRVPSEVFVRPLSL